jgi:hypothetical protein
MEFEIGTEHSRTLAAAGVVKLEDLQANMSLSRDEAATIFFALNKYEEVLRSDLQNTFEADYGESSKNEDRLFYHEALRGIYKLLFDIFDNHPTAERIMIRNWFDV